MAKQDERVARMLEQRLISQGLRPPCRVTPTVFNGVVTLSGTVQYDYQKRAAVQACRAVNGVRNVVDQIQIAPIKRSWE